MALQHALAGSKVLPLFSNFSSADLQNYQTVKREILSFYSLTAEDYKRKVLTATQEKSETFRQYVRRVETCVVDGKRRYSRRSHTKDLKNFYLKKTP